MEEAKLWNIAPNVPLTKVINGTTPGNYLYVNTLKEVALPTLAYSTTYAGLTFRITDNQGAYKDLKNLSFSTIADNIAPTDVAKAYTTYMYEDQNMNPNDKIAELDFYQSTDNSGDPVAYYTWRFEYLLAAGAVYPDGGIANSQILRGMIQDQDYLGSVEHNTGDTFNTMQVTYDKLYRPNVNYSGSPYENYSESKIVIIARDGSTSLTNVPTWNFSNVATVQKPGDVMGYTDASNIEWPDGRLKPFDAVKSYMHILTGEDVHVHTPYVY